MTVDLRFTPTMASHTVENYLKALFALANEAGEGAFQT